MRGRDRQRTKISIRVLQLTMLGFCLVVLGRVFHLQILQHEKYEPLSKKNALRQEYVSPARGLIYDRSGNLLVDNEPIYSITITPSKFDESNIPLIADLVGVTDSLVRSRVQEAQKYSWYRSSILFSEVNFREFTRIQENIWRLPGVGHQINSKRHYPTEVQASHVFGYLREASELELEHTKTLRLGSTVGKSGLEQKYGEFLRGQGGVEYVQVNALGQMVSNYEHGNLDRPPKKGADLITTLDLELQKTAETLMEDKIGGVIAINPRNGAVLAMVSSPQYKLERLAGELDKSYWEKINSDTTDPLFNRVISSKQPPGSTFKPFMALTGLDLGIVNPSTVVHCDGAFYKGRTYKCIKAHGDQTLAEAIENSCNTYFFSLMNQIGTHGKLNEWHNDLTDFGLGQRNNIDLPNEVSGIIPDSSFLHQTFGKNKWGIGDVINLGVGQGLISVSPLQMSVAVSAIANGGYHIQPHLVQSIRKRNGQIVHPEHPKKQIPWIGKEQLEVVKEGMRRVVTEGGGRWYANSDSVKIAGKTGTAQNPHGRDHSWFISFGPTENPEIAVAAFVENAGYGSLTAAPIASLLIEKYVTGKIYREHIYRRMLNFSYDELANQSGE